MLSLRKSKMIPFLWKGKQLNHVQHRFLTIKLYHQEKKIRDLAKDDTKICKEIVRTDNWTEYLDQLQLIRFNFDFDNSTKQKP